MIDTLALKHNLARPPTEEDLRLLGWQSRYNRRDGTIYGFVQNERNDNNEPRLTISQTPNGVWFIKAEASLPKLFRGVNVPLLDENEIESSLRLFSASVERRSGIAFNAETALVSRVDYTRDFQLGESNIITTVAKFMRVQIPSYDHESRNDTTVIFTPKGEKNSKRIIVYGKYAEVLQRDGSEEEQHFAQGILRVEVSLRTRAIGYVADKCGLPNREARYILKPDVANYVLDDALRKIQFENVINANDDNTIETLISHYGSTKAKGLIGFLEIRKQRGEDFYKHDELHYSSRTYFKDLAACRKAGVLPYD